MMKTKIIVWAITSLLSIILTVLLFQHLSRSQAVGRTGPVSFCTTTDDCISRMNMLARQGRYAEAIRTGLNALHNTSADAGVYSQLAMVYLVRARKDQDRERWTEAAAMYFNKAVDLQSQDPVNVMDAARGFEMAGDLATSRRCAYYYRAAELSKSLSRLLGSDHVTIGGTPYSLDPSTKDFVAYGHRFSATPLKDENGLMSDRLTTKTQKCQAK